MLASLLQLVVRLLSGYSVVVFASELTRRRTVDFGRLCASLCYS